MITKLRYLQGNKRLFYNIDIFQLSTHELKVSEQRTDIALTGIYNTSHTSLLNLKHHIKYKCAGQNQRDDNNVNRRSKAL